MTETTHQYAYPCNRCGTIHEFGKPCKEKVNSPNSTDAMDLVSALLIP